MKKTLLALLLMLSLILTACAARATTIPPPPTATMSPPPTATEIPAIVTFADPALEAMVRGVMGKPTGEITVTDAEAVTMLNLSNPWRRDIPDEAAIHAISGLESFRNLKNLDLSFNEVADLTPLSGLKNLTSLSLDGNPIQELAPLASLTNLELLALSGCAAQDYSPLAGLANLRLLRLDHSTLTDVSPLVSLTSLKYLYLEGSPIDTYFPLSAIYQNLAQKDFTIASTLAELGFVMDNDRKQAIHDDNEIASVRINHSEWGAPQDEWANNCVQTVFAQNDYKIGIGYYPNSDAYVVMAFKDGEMALNYVYDHAKDNFGFSVGDRENSEQVVRAIFADTDAEDVLLAPMQTFHDNLTKAVGVSANTLFKMPFEPPTLSALGFFPNEANTAYAYQEHEPRDMHISIYKPEWGERPENSNPEGSNIEFYDHDVNGYSLLILYFADTGRYHISLFKEGVECAFDVYPATGEKGWEYPDLDTVHRMFNDAFGTKDKELYDKPLVYFEQAIQDRFGMNINELYALPVGK